MPLVGSTIPLIDFKLFLESRPAWLLKAIQPPLPRLTAFRLGAAVAPRGQVGWVTARAKFLARALLHPSATAMWGGALSHGFGPDLIRLHPRLAGKLQRPYLHCRWNVRRKLEALRAHYAALPSLLAHGALLQAYGRGLTLLRLHDQASGRRLELRLSYLDQFEKEGELNLALVDEGAGLALAGMTFALVETAGLLSLWIGGLQSTPDPKARACIAEVTKELHGFRPKALLFWAVQGLARSWKLRDIRAVSDDAHIYRHRHKRRAFAARYDTFWSECGGTRAGSQWLLPLETAQRPRSEIKPSRRKAHERRYALLRSLEPDWTAALTAVAPPRPPNPFLANRVAPAKTFGFEGGRPAGVFIPAGEPVLAD